jgi:hypothetical protein
VTTDAGKDAGEVAAAALAGRKEQALLAEPSVARVADVLASRCRNPAPWVRSAVATLGRFAGDVADGDLAGLLARGRGDPGAAAVSLDDLARRHGGRTATQVANLQFGPKLWWTLNGVPVPWRPPVAATPGPSPIPGARTGGRGDVRLVLLALLGSGLTVDELFAVRVRDAGSLDAAGRVVPDPRAEPLALEYPAGDSGRRLTFLSPEARAALLDRHGDARGQAEPLLPAGDARAAAAVRSRRLIDAGNDVNVTLCRATGDFFREWGMPGARFDARVRGPE